MVRPGSVEIGTAALRSKYAGERLEQDWEAGRLLRESYLTGGCCRKWKWGGREEDEAVLHEPRQKLRERLVQDQVLAALAIFGNSTGSECLLYLDFLLHSEDSLIKPKATILVRSLVKPLKDQTVNPLLPLQLLGLPKPRMAFMGLLPPGH